MIKKTKDAIRAYAAEVPHVSTDTLMREINARVPKDAADSTVCQVAHDVIREHESAARLLTVNARHRFVAATQ